MPRLFCLAVVFLLPCLAHAQVVAEARAPWAGEASGSYERHTGAVHAARADAPPTIDGRLDEAVWQHAEVVTGFVQREPENGAPASERTVVRILYDDDALYVGARMYDSAPDSIIARLGRRDADINTDLFGFYVDPYFDRRSGYYFGLSAAGTRYDGVLYNDSWDDDSWDGVWQGKAARDDAGWTAELRIPLSQLRFQERDPMVWGIDFRRDIARRNEEAHLILLPRNESGYVSRFRRFEGLTDVRPARQIEVIPYVTAKAAFADPEDGNPFEDGSAFTPQAGADFKVGLSSNLTLNATVNPDFGQVEVDPAVVNLSDVETFFPEKRPFFIEGASVFNFGYGGASNNFGFNWSAPDLFYSRRIGRSPQGGLPDHDYADMPEAARILGAAKLTGRVGDWNVGAIQSLTGSADAEYVADGARHEAEVEPLASYSIGRAQREWADGRQGLGVLATSTVRRFGRDALRDELNGEAFVGGLDGWTFLDADRRYVLNGWVGASHVRGSTERLVSLQRSHPHYFQRPDADHVGVDSSVTSLSGFAGRVALGKERGNVLFNTAFGFISPGFESNDLGFQSRADYLNGHVVSGYTWAEPRGIFRRKQYMASLFYSSDFEGNRLGGGLWNRAYFQFTNFMWLEAGGAVVPYSYSRGTRGGPLMRDPAGYEAFVSTGTNSSKALSGSTGVTAWGARGGSQGWNASFEVTWRPAPNVAFSVEPSVRHGLSAAQYVDTVDDPAAAATYGQRYVFGELDQWTVASGVRLNWTFSPELSLQLFAQPLISAGDFSGFKELAAPRTFRFATYGQDAGTLTRQGDDIEIDPDGAGPAEAFSFQNPDFNFRSLRGNAVLRWEYRPGSTLFFVWTQERSESVVLGDLDFGPSLGRLVNADAENIFVVKWTYWLGR